MSLVTDDMEQHEITSTEVETSTRRRTIKESIQVQC